MIKSSIVTNMYRDKIPLDVVLHGQRVGLLAYNIGATLGLEKEILRDIAISGYIHDYGKMYIDDKILFKEGTLTASEKEEMKKHVEYSSLIARNNRYLSKYSEIVRYHHEYEDGTGYLKKASSEVPFISKIIVIADIYDALCSERSYRPAFSCVEAMREMGKMEEKFEPQIFEAFLELTDQNFYVMDKILKIV